MIVPRAYLAAGGVLVVGVLAFLLWARSRGGPAGVGQAVGAAVVDAAGGLVSGSVGAAGEAVGLPTPGQTITDPKQARWLIDRAGHFEASRWAGAYALIAALRLPPGSGHPPPIDSAAGQRFAHLAAGGIVDTGDELGRLMTRFPPPARGPAEQVDPRLMPPDW